MLYGPAVACCVFSLCWAVYTIVTTAEAHAWRDPTESWILALILFAYVLAWLPVALLPLDIASIEGGCDDSAHDSLRGWWQLLYVANLVTGYTLYDFTRSYVDSGAFTIRRKAKLGWDMVWKWYAWALLIILPFFLLIAWNNRFNFSAWQVTYESIYAVASTATAARTFGSHHPLLSRAGPVSGQTCTASSCSSCCCRTRSSSCPSNYGI